MADPEKVRCMHCGEVTDIYIDPDDGKTRYAEHNNAQNEPCSKSGKLLLPNESHQDCD